METNIKVFVLAEKVTEFEQRNEQEKKRKRKNRINKKIITENKNRIFFCLYMNKLS